MTAIAAVMVLTVTAINMMMIKLLMLLGRIIRRISQGGDPRNEPEQNNISTCRLRAERCGRRATQTDDLDGEEEGDHKEDE